MDLVKAIVSLKPDAEWVLKGDEYSGLEWHDNKQSKPTEAELIAECNRLQSVYDSKQYQRDRANAYPSIVDQLDTLYHGGFDAWKATIDAVKNQYPKP